MISLLTRLPAHAWARAFFGAVLKLMPPAPRARAGEGARRKTVQRLPRGSPRTRGRGIASENLAEPVKQLPAHAWARESD